MTQSAGEEAVLSFAFQPEIRLDNLLVRFSLDPFHIPSAAEADGWRDWVSYITRYISEVDWQALDGRFTFNIGSKLILPADPFGVSSALTNSFKPTTDSLSLLSTYEGTWYTHTLSYSDITLQEEEGFLNYSANYNIPGQGMRFGLSLLTQVDHEALKDLVFYPEAHVYAPLIESSVVDLALQVTGAMAFDLASDQAVDGWGMSVSVPLTAGRFSLDTGIAWTVGGLQYGQFLNGYITERDNGNTLMFHSSASYVVDPFSLIIDLQLPLENNTGRIVEGEDYFSFEFSGELFGISLAAGVRMMGLVTDTTNAWDEHGQGFIALGYQNEAIETRMAVYFNEGLVPEIAFSAAVDGYRAIFAPDTGHLSTTPSWLEVALDTGYSYGTSSSVFIRPRLTFLLEDSSFALRFPFILSTSDGHLSFGNEQDDIWYDFGIGSASTFDLLYDFFTDIATMIESINIGSVTSSHLFLSREDRVPAPSFFDPSYGSYGRQAPLSLDALLVIPSRASLSLFADNLERPRIMSFSVSVLPMGSIGPEVTVEAAMDMKFNALDYEALLIPRISMGKTFLDGRLDLSAYVSTIMEFSPTSFLMHVFGPDQELAAGLALEARIGGFTIPLSGGVATGRAREHHFDAFTRLGLSECADTTWIEGLAGYLQLGLGYEAERFNGQVSYEVVDFSSLASGRSGDQLTLSLSYTYNDVDISAAMVRRNLAGGIREWTDAGSFFFSPDNVFSLSVEKTFGHLGFYFSLFSSAPLSEDPDYDNVITADGEASTLGFSIISTLRF